MSSANSETFIAVFDGIRADQWPANSNTRVFQITVVQSNGYSLSADTTVTLNQLPQSECICVHNIEKHYLRNCQCYILMLADCM